MIKSLLLAVVCAYTNPPGLQPNVPAVQVHFDLLKELGMAGLQGAEAAAANEAAGRPFWQLAPEHVAAGDLCSKLEAEPAATSEALNAFVNVYAAYAMELPAIPMPRPRPKAVDAYAMEPSAIVVDENMHPTSMDPRSGNRGRKAPTPTTASINNKAKGAAALAARLQRWACCTDSEERRHLTPMRPLRDGDDM